MLVEPTWSCVAVAAALDAGWESVELAREAGDDAAPLPLVSFEARPPAGATRCRVRSDDLVRAIGDPAAGVELPVTLLLGAPAFARPLASAIARSSPAALRLVACPAPDGAMAADSWWAAGMLVRVLLEELDGATTLSDAAGIAVTLAQGAEDVSTQIAAGARWRRHLERGGHPDDLRVASAVDSIGVVPIVAAEGDAVVARAWLR